MIEFKNVYKAFGNIEVLHNLSFTIKEGSFTAITGASGSGKSTILNIMGLLDSADRGSVRINMHENVKPFSKDATEILRNEIGYLFQNFALIDNKSVKYNLMIALEHVKEKNKSKLITEALVKVGMAGFENKKILECSGGEQQRIAIARLLLKPCQIILCDEPTGSLDEENKQVVFDLLKYLQEQGKTLVVVTHDDELVEIADEVILIHKYNETAS